MNRWTSRTLASMALFALCSSAVFSSAAFAQTEEAPVNTRKFPPEAKRGELVVFSAPDVSIDGKPDRLAPGVRIRDASNALVLSSTLVNVRLLVNYTRGNTGLLQNIWVLNTEEAKLKMPGQPEGFFSNIGSMFDKPVAKDDGNTPFNQLPKYKQ